MNGKHVVMAFPGDGIGGRIFPPDLARFLNDFYRQKGVEVLPGERVTGWEMRAGQAHPEDPATLKPRASGRSRPTPWWRGSASSPTSSWPRRPGWRWTTASGSIACLRTSQPDIYAAGDVANFYNPALDQRLRVEHEDNANTMGRLAGQAMAGRAGRL